MSKEYRSKDDHRLKEAQFRAEALDLTEKLISANNRIGKMEDEIRELRRQVGEMSTALTRVAAAIKDLTK